MGIVRGAIVWRAGDGCPGGIAQGRIVLEPLFLLVFTFCAWTKLFPFNNIFEKICCSYSVLSGTVECPSCKTEDIISYFVEEAGENCNFNIYMLKLRFFLLQSLKNFSFIVFVVSRCKLINELYILSYCK